MGKRIIKKMLAHSLSKGRRTFAQLLTAATPPLQQAAMGE